MYRYTSYYEEEYNTTEIELGSNLMFFYELKWEQPLQNALQIRSTTSMLILCTQCRAALSMSSMLYIKIHVYKNRMLTNISFYYF